MFRSTRRTIAIALLAVSGLAVGAGAAHAADPSPGDGLIHLPAFAKPEPVDPPAPINPHCLVDPGSVGAGCHHDFTKYIPPAPPVVGATPVIPDPAIVPPQPTTTTTMPAVVMPIGHPTPIVMQPQFTG